MMGYSNSDKNAIIFLLKYIQDKNNLILMDNNYISNKISNYQSI